MSSSSSSSSTQEIIEKFLMASNQASLDAVVSNLNEILASAASSFSSESPKDGSSWLSSEYLSQIHASKGFISRREHHDDMENLHSQEGKDLLRGVQSYVQDYFSNEDSAVKVTMTTGSDFNIFISVRRIRLNQYHVGSWSSQYTLTKHLDKYILSGTLEIHTQAFEGLGNIHNDCCFTFPNHDYNNNNDGTIFISTMEDAVRNIQQWETKCLLRLHQIYDNMGDTMKRFRRIMPVTRQKFAWNVTGPKGLHELTQHLHFTKK